LTNIKAIDLKKPYNIICGICYFQLHVEPHKNKEYYKDLDRQFKTHLKTHSIHELLKGAIKKLTGL
jgi:hypothetical protein